ncbi:Prephenate dehydratase-domain-containing protein [Pyronema omphalodes]|nr:Prephenate dehydratase-domain-containing protein [Pyronema omphalodes]
MASPTLATPTPPPTLPSVGYLGPPSSYSHQAALECFDNNTHTFVSQTTIADIFVAVQNKTVTYGVVPFENSTNGSVVFTLDLFCDRNNAYPDVHICGETYLDVHHCLLSCEEEIKSLKRLYSHPQAFGQCEVWLNSTVKGIERIDVSSTSKAAEKAKNEPGAAAIASRIAADVHGLKVLARNIEDTSDNTTRFFVLSATERSEPTQLDGRNDKTLLSFITDHQPGALCDGLKVFKDFGLNLTSIVSRPSRKMPWNYIFFVEFEGHEKTKNVTDALEALKPHCAEMRVLGSFIDKQKLRKPSAVVA